MSKSAALNRETIVKACNLAQLRLDAQALGPMVSRSQFDRIADHFIEVLSAADLLPPKDFDDLRTALDDEVARRDLSIAVNGLLHGKRSMEERFKHALGVFAHWNLARWSLMTVWSFLRYPDRYLLINSSSSLTSASQKPLPTKPDWPSFCRSQQGGLKIKKQLDAEDLIEVVIHLRVSEVTK